MWATAADRLRRGRRTPPVRVLLPPALVVALVAACSQGSFDRTASDTASTLLGAAATLEFVHAGKATVPYGRAAFVEYGSRLDGVADELATLPGAPPRAEAQGLVALVRAATAVVDDPCLDRTCDWQRQQRILESAGRALLAASGGQGGG